MDDKYFYTCIHNYTQVFLHVSLYVCVCAGKCRIKLMRTVILEWCWLLCCQFDLQRSIKHSIVNRRRTVWGIYCASSQTCSRQTCTRITLSLSHDAYKNMHTTHTHLAISALELGLAAAHRGATSLKAPDHTQIVTLARLNRASPVQLI